MDFWKNIIYLMGAFALNLYTLELMPINKSLFNVMILKASYFQASLNIK